nr:hypothetical protein [Bacillota bacterium]
MKGSRFVVIFLVSVAILMGGQGLFAAATSPPSRGGTPTDPYSTCNSLVVLSATDIQQMKEAERAIVASGGIVRFRFPPHIFYAWIPDGQVQELAGRMHIDSIYSGYLQPTAVSEYGRGAVSAVQSWNEVFIKHTAGVNVQLPEEPAPEPNDTLEVPPEGWLHQARGNRMVSGPAGRGANDTSEFMLGNVAITIILPESDGSTDTET